jgi:hypothetical protein
MMTKSRKEERRERERERETRGVKKGIFDEE